MEEPRLRPEGRRNCRGRPWSRGGCRRKQGYTGRSGSGRMIRHTFCRGGLRPGEGLALPISALAVAVIEAAFFGLLMATISDAVLSAAGEAGGGGATVDLLRITTWADEKKRATARRATKALPKGSLTIIRQVDSGDNRQPRPKMGKWRSPRACASETEHPRQNPGCSNNRGFIFSSRIKMLTK